MSGVYRRISKPASRIEVYWNDTNLKRIFEELHPDQQHKFNVNAFKVAGNRLKKMVAAEANAQGLSNQTQKSNDGWTWQTFGRIPRSIATGKVWKNGAITTMRVFMRTGKKHGFLNRAPHGNIVVAGYKQHIPKSGVTGKGTGVESGETKAGRAIFENAKRNASAVFVKSLEASISRMIKRINKKYT